MPAPAAQGTRSAPGAPGAPGATTPQGSTAPVAPAARATDVGADADGTRQSGNQQSTTASAIEQQTDFQRFVQEATGRALGLYGFDLFSRGSFTASQGASVPASYVLGPGDEVVVQAYGMVDITERLTIDREGRVLVPKAGPLTLAGVPLGEAERVISAHLAKIYRNFNLTVTMGRVRSAEVFVVGQARNPGKHVVSGLSTLINALFETGGPNANGSLRAVELRRAGKTVATVDVYQFLAKGDNSADAKLQPGDVIFIPPAGPRAAVLGTVNAPAIYELKAEDTLKSVLDLTGGLPVLAAPQKAQLERINPSRDIARYVEDFALDAGGLARKLQAGDVLTVFPISPQISNVVTLQGNVATPMRYAFRKGMKVADLVTGNNFLVPVQYWLSVNAGGNIGGLDRPEVNLDYATIQRLDLKRLRTVLIPFHLAKALRGDAKENLALEPGDIVRVYGPAEAGPEAFESVSLNAQFIGGTRRFPWRAGTTVRDLIPDAAWLQNEVSRWVRATGGAPLEGYAKQELNFDYAVIRRLDPVGLRSELFAFNLGKAMAGDAVENLALQPGDRLILYGPNEAGAETLNSITIRGEMLGGERRFIWRPGFAIRDIIPSADWLVSRYQYWQQRGGKELRNDINWDYGQVIRRLPDTLQTRTFNFNLGGAVLQGKAEDNLTLQPGDQITLFTTRELPVPQEKRIRLVTLSGEVKVPGVYQVAAGETLREIIQRAGGYTADAYVYGLDFRRESTRVTQQQNLERAVQRIETQTLSNAQSKLQNITSTEQAQAAQASLQADQLRLAALRNLKATGRVAMGLNPERIELPSIPLEDGDIITVPNRPAFVGVYGAVNNENALIWRPGMTLRDVVNSAGTNLYADVSESYILRADGTVLGGGQMMGLFGFGGIISAKLQPGDTVVVPERADRETAYTTFIRGAKDITAIFYQFGIGAAALKTLKN